MHAAKIKFYLVISFLSCVLFLSMAIPRKDALAQLIHGNTFPYWNVGSGGLTVTGPTSLAGAIDASSASAGIIGEVLSESRLSSAASSLTTATKTNVVCKSLTAGDWDVNGTVVYALSGATTTKFVTAIGLSGAAVGDSDYADPGTVVTTTTKNIAVPAPSKRVNISSTASYCVTATPTFSAGTETAWGEMFARRVR